VADVDLELIVAWNCEGSAFGVKYRRWVSKGMTVFVCTSLEGY
jgi:hypothetical protein